MDLTDDSKSVHSGSRSEVAKKFKQDLSSKKNLGGEVKEQHSPLPELQLCTGLKLRPEPESLRLDPTEPAES